MSTRHRIKYEDDSHTLSTTFDSGLGVPTAATVEAKDHSGTCLFGFGTIDSVADAGGGTCTISYTRDDTYPYPGEGADVSNYVTIAGTDTLDGKYLISSDDGSTFVITATFTATETGTYTVQRAATLFTASTLSAAATAGEAEITLASVTSLTEGSVVRIAMSADGQSEDVEIASVNTSTKVCGLTDYLRFDHTSGAAVSGRFVSYDIDVSDTDIYTSGLDIKIIWDLYDTDDPAWSEDAEILKRSVAFGGLEAEFKDGFAHYYAEIPSGGFASAQKRAYETLRRRFSQTVQRDLDKLVNPEDLEEILFWQIAYNIAWAGDDSWEREQVATKQTLDELINRFAGATNIWIDDDQDDVEDDEDVQPMDRPLPRRRL